MLLLYRGDQFNSNFYYHSGVDIDHSFLLLDGIGNQKKILFVPKLNESIARAAQSDSSFRGRVCVYTDPIETLSKFIRGKKVIFDAGSMSARLASKLGKICKLQDHSEALLKMRAVKRDDEVACVRKAVKYTKQIFDSLDLKTAKTELDLQKQLLLATIELGLESAFEPIVSSGKNTAYPHYRAGNKKLQSVVMVDYGVRYKHYCADLTRCFILDGDKKKKEQYERLQDICYFLADSLPNLERGKDVAKLGADLIDKAGFPKMIHSIGHGVGLDVHEFPSLKIKSEDALSGATLAIEPAFYLKNYGMRFEETIYFDGKRTRIL
jgi:Xaa-Pro aminopeptidase